MTDPALRLALVEITLGNMLHAARIPFRGHLLAMNQALLLNHAVRLEGSTTDPLRISCLAGLAKVLSINIKRVTPAVAIAVQGALFTTGLALMGRGRLGRILGSFLLLLWPTLQRCLLWGSLLFISGTATARGLLSWSLLLIVSGTLLVAVLIGYCPQRLTLDTYLKSLRSRGQAESNGGRSAWPPLIRELTSLPVLVAFAAHLFCGWWDGATIKALFFRAGGLFIGLTVLLYMQHLLLSQLTAARFRRWMPAAWGSQLDKITASLRADALS